MALQHYCDPFTGNLFLLPENAWTYTGWKKWLDTLDTNKQVPYTPYLTRVTSGEFEIGNLTFVPRAIGKLAEFYNGLTNLRNILSQPYVGAIIAPQPQLVYDQACSWELYTENTMKRITKNDQ